MPSHYLNQCGVNVNWTIRNKPQWNFNHNTKIFIHENASENIICEMAAILPRGDEIIINIYVWISPLSPICVARSRWVHYCGVIMVANASQITRLTIVYSAVYSDAHQRKQQSSASPVPGEFPAQMASYAEKVSIWGRHHVKENKLFDYGIYVMLIRVWCMSQIGLNVLCYSCHVYFSDFVSWIEDKIF